MAFVGAGHASWQSPHPSHTDASTMGNPSRRMSAPGKGQRSTHVLQKDRWYARQCRPWTMATRAPAARAGGRFGGTATFTFSGRLAGAAGADTRGAASDRFRPSQVARKSRRLTDASGMKERGRSYGTGATGGGGKVPMTSSNDRDDGMYSRVASSAWHWRQLCRDECVVLMALEPPSP